MNKQQRNQWDDFAYYATKVLLNLTNEEQAIIVAANAYILKLERELQNIKGGRKIAAILKSKVSV